MGRGMEVEDGRGLRISRRGKPGGDRSEEQAVFEVGAKPSPCPLPEYRNIARHLA